MRMSRTVALAFVLGQLSPAPVAGQSAPDRSAAPAPGPAPRIVLPQVQKHALANDLPVWVVERHGVPMATLRLVIRTGSAADPVGKFGLSSLTAAMLAEGAAGRDALSLADELDYLGADLQASSSFDATVVALSVPVARLAPALAIMADVVLRPDFPQRELDRLRERRLTALRTAKDNPQAIASVAFPQIVYGAGHRYGTAATGTSDTLRGLTRDDLQRFHAAHVRPDHAALVVVGDVTPAGLLPMLESALGGWRTPSAPLPAESLRTPAPLKTRTVTIVDKPGAAQSVLQIGAVGVARSTPDYFAIEVMNTILGGSFTSRLNENLREQHGYAYGAGSGFDMRRAAGPFWAGAAVQTDKTAEAVTEFLNELKGMRQPVPAEELRKAKNYLALGFPGRFETSRDVAAAYGELLVYGLPDDYYATYVDRLLAVTQADVARVATQYVQPERLAVVIVGDREAIESRVRGLALGPVQVLAVDAVIR
jgi:predicted Zn-dependent peptidase